MAFIPNSNYSNYIAQHPKDNNNEQIRKERQKATELYIIDINNKLCELCQFLNLDLPEIKKINPNDYGSDKFWKNEFGDKEKKVVISSIIAEENIIDDSAFKRLRFDEEIAKAKAYEEALKYAGITDTQLAWLNGQNLSDERVRREALNAVGLNEQKISKLMSDKYVAQEMRDKIKSRVLKTGHPKGQPGQPPPKTDWKRIDVSKDEKTKIIESLRANPNSKLSLNKFPWDIKDFFKAFEYIEDSKNYTGPFIVSIVKDSEEIGKYSKIYENISNIYEGKYLLLSVYDITASGKNADEAKYFYIGLSYSGMEGALKFDKLGSIKGKIKNSQKTLVKEFLDAMKINYNNNHEDLKFEL